MNDERDSTPAEQHTVEPPDSGESAAAGASTPASPASSTAPQPSPSRGAKSNGSRATIREHPYRVLMATVAVLLSLLGMAGIKSYRDLAVAQDIERGLLQEIGATTERLQALSEYIGRIENDPATLERLAREELGMVREGDVVIVLPDEDSEIVERPSPTANNTL
ncbi:MAG: septum formation initiator family protein [Acidobacteriota bacterium]